jgi:hypothetical protein
MKTSVIVFRALSVACFSIALIVWLITIVAALSSFSAQQSGNALWINFAFAITSALLGGVFAATASFLACF